MDAQETVMCWICLSESAMHKQLNCGHGFCEKCLTDYKKKDSMFSGVFPCPVCKKEGIKVEIESDMEMKENFEYCYAHDREQLEKFCVTCQKLVCNTCIKTTHRNHSTSTMEFKRPEIIAEFQNAEQDLETQMVKFEQYSDEIRSQFSFIRKMGETACAEVDTRVQEYTKAIADVADEMKSKIWECCLTEERELDEKLTQSATAKHQIKATLKYAEDVLKENSLKEIGQFKIGMKRQKKSNDLREFNGPVVKIPRLSCERQIDKAAIQNQMGSVCVLPKKT